MLTEWRSHGCVATTPPHAEAEAEAAKRQAEAEVAATALLG
jgi:hypothetical protein